MHGNGILEMYDIFPCTQFLPLPLNAHFPMSADFGLLAENEQSLSSDRITPAS